MLAGISEREGEMVLCVQIWSCNAHTSVRIDNGGTSGQFVCLLVRNAAD